MPVIPESYSHVLAECDSLDPLLSALRLDSSRLKCTCVAVSRKWLVLGSSAGGLHLIQKEGWKQRLILTHKEGAVSRVACCPHDEDFVAVATSQGVVVVWHLHLESRGKPERVCVSTEHRDRAVTALCWDSTQHRLFVGDAVGRVSTVRASSSKQGKGASFVMFPVQTVTTVDSRVVQLSYLEGRLLVSSLTRCYLCDTDREKFWRIGNKERDGEYGACFFPAVRNAGSPQALIYCARPGSRMWEVNFEGEVLSTHQFKQLLASPPLPLITHRSEPLYGTSPCSPQSISFPRLLFLSDQYVLTWTERGIYIFLPQSVQVLLWSEIKGWPHVFSSLSSNVQDISVYRNELFCLHGDGRLSHLSLLPVERCVERLLRRESWGLAATVCCLFQHAVSPSRARKSLPIDRLEHLKGQLDSSTQHELIGQLEEVISKLEPFDSASSSRRSSISSHESFNVLDCGIYRVISRRGSQSDEDASSLVSQTLSEDERLREFSSAQEEEPAEHETICSVSSFVRKTTEKINTLQMPSDLWPKPDGKEEGQLREAVVTYPQEQEQEVCTDGPLAEKDELQGLKEATARAVVCTDGPPAEKDELRGLKEATARAVAQLQDPLVLLNTDSLLEVLRTWLPALERAWGLPEDRAESGGDVQSPVRHWGDAVDPACDPQKDAVRGGDSTSAAAEGAPGLSDGPEDSRDPADQIEEAGCPNHGGATDHPAALPTSPQEHSGVSEDSRTDPGETILEGGSFRDGTECTPAPPDPMRVTPPCELHPELHRDLTELATLCLELGCFHGDGATPCRFLHRFFFLLDLERARRSCLMRYRDCPAVWGAYTAGLRALERAWGLPEDSAESGGDVQSPVRHWGDAVDPACDPQKDAVRGGDSTSAAAEGATGLSDGPEDSRDPADQIEEAGCPNHGGATDHPAALPTSPQEHIGVSEDSRTDPGETILEGGGFRDGTECTPAPPDPMRVTPPCELHPELHRDLTELATLCLELGCFHGDGATPCRFLHRFFFLLDLERARRSCLMRYRDCPAVWGAYTAGLRELTLSSPGTVVLEEGDLLKSLRYLRAQEPWNAALLLAHLSRLYERHGELALRSFGQFYPTIIPADVMALSRRSPAHFLAYLDNLVKWKPAEQRLSMIGSFLQPESLRQDWLELALSHDAPQLVDTISPEGNPRSRSHLFSWGYGQLLSLLLKLPGDLKCKENMAETCRSHGFWTGYLYLCWQLERRTEAFSVIVSLDDMGLLEGPNGVMPDTLEEWKYLLQTTQSKADEPASPCSTPGNGLANGGSDWSSHVNLENMTLLLARTVGPDRALAVLQECGLSVELSERSALVCEILRIAEKRQR
ncbi:UNVERIFIED_CONTAM: hypothetical protein FKN15_059515 [Acipenser sinensis]